MVVYQPKGTAPAAFNAVDALLSFIHNDPVYGWLENFVHLYPNSYINTAAFCTAGPMSAPPLTLADLTNLFPPGSGDWIAANLRIATRVESVLHDHLFGAMCNEVTPVVAGWSSSYCLAIAVAPPSSYSSVYFEVPAGATQMRMRLQSFTPIGGAGGFNLQVYGINNVGASTGLQGSYGNTGPWPTGWTQRAISGAVRYQAQNFATNGSGVLCLQFDVATPIPVPPPNSVVPPNFVSRTVPPTAAVADLAPLLFALELKLESLLAHDWQDAVNALPASSTVATAIDAPTNTVVNLPTALGLIVTLSAVPPQSDVEFGTPQQLAKLARVNFGTDAGWYPSIPVTHTPFIVRPLPPGTTKVTVTVDPPATATVSPILPAAV